MPGRDVIARFADALDRSDFEAARRLIAPDAAYRIGEEIHRGPDAIVASYRAADESAHVRFDSIGYDSRLLAVTDHGATIEFVDHLVLAEERLTHRCHQHLTVDAQDLIATIEHEDLPGERDAVRAFLTRHGIE